MAPAEIIKYGSKSQFVTSLASVGRGVVWPCASAAAGRRAASTATTRAKPGEVIRRRATDKLRGEGTGESCTPARSGRPLRDPKSYLKTAARRAFPFP